MSSTPFALGAPALLAVLACLGAAARGWARTRRAAHRSDVRDEPATGLDRRFARLHYELLRARTELRACLDMSVDHGLDLRHDGTDDPRGVPGDDTDRCDQQVVADARQRLADLWQGNAHLLGNAQDPLWHVRGRLDWVRTGATGRQVLTVRATLGHDPGRWVAVKAVRRTRRAVPAMGGGGSRLGGTLRADDPAAVLRALCLGLAQPATRPSLGCPTPHPLRGLHRLRAALAQPRWELVTVEVLGTGGPWTTWTPTATSLSTPTGDGTGTAMGRATRSAVTSRPSGTGVLNPGPERPDHLDRKR